MKEFTKRQIKVFLQLKWKEISPVLLLMVKFICVGFVGAIVLIAFLVGIGWIVTNLPMFVVYLQVWIYYLWICICCGFLCFLILIGLQKWLSSNWKQARDIVIEEMKKK